MRYLYLSYVVMTLIVLSIWGCDGVDPDVIREFAAELPEVVDYNFHIKPLLSDRCYKCHGPDANTRKGDFRLDIEEEALVRSNGSSAKGTYILRPNALRKSELYHRIISEDDAYQMPPPESNLNLTRYEQALIARWIQQGATYQPHWSFVPPKQAAVPEVNGSWASHDMDHFILDRMSQEGLVPNETADKTTLLRRASFDLTGLPPTPEEAMMFVQSDELMYERAIDKLLDSPHFGERMALDWLDVARYADTHGYQDDGMRTTWPWRDWVIRAYNENLRYDDFITWQLAGDLLENPTTDQLLATCFNRNHPQTQEGGIVDEEYRVEYVADRTNTFGKAFLGLTTECARCHDHKYDPISQKDYYSLYAFFNNNNESGIVPYNGEASPTILLPTSEEAIQLDSLRRLIDSLNGHLVSDEYLEEFEAWYDGQDSDVQLEKDRDILGDFSFEKEMSASKRTMNLDRRSRDELPEHSKQVTAFYNEVKAKPDATIWGDVERRPIMVEGVLGNGLQFNGDAGVRFNRDIDIDRGHPFSVSLWIKPLRDSLSGPIYNNSNGDFEGYRGWLCKLNIDGSLSFQLNHVWPDNAIDIRTNDRILVDEWSHIVMVYDGSSKASGVRIFINGDTPSHTILKDNLHKSLLHGVNKTNWSNLPFILGMELRKSIEDLAMDELKVYGRQLSLPEVIALYKHEDSFDKGLFDKEDLYDHYLYSGYNKDYNTRSREVAELRHIENVLATDQKEVMIMQERGEVRPTYVLNRGMYDQPQEQVTPEVPGIFTEANLQIRNRLDLARWLVDDDHPLTSRVVVNRIWKMLFGRGIVSTQEDFGSQGSLPTHPELLDHLALKLIDLDWNIKAFLKYVMTSATYTQSSMASEAARLQDPQNLWYSHFPAHRLSAEAIRDNALAGSGLLARQVGGPSVYPYQPGGLWKALATRNATEYVQQHGDSLYRRSMYTVWKRSSPPPSMMTFDAPDRYYCVVDRQKTATPLQSLVLMNDVQFLEAARVLAARMISQQQCNPIVYAFLSLVSRAPDESELAILTDQLQKALEIMKDDPQKAMSWISAGEYKKARDMDNVILAAHTMVASTIMNFDEFVMKR